MRVLMLNYEYPPIGGGAGRAHQQLLEAYAGMGDLQIDVLTSGLLAGLCRESLAANVTLYKMGIRKSNLHYWRKREVISWLWNARKVYRRLVRENNYDLVHAFFGFPSGWLCYHCQGRLPYIISLRGSDVPGYNERLGWDYRVLSGLFRRIWAGAGAVVANSGGLRELALKFMPEMAIQVIPNGVDTKRFCPPQEKMPSVQPKLLAVGRLIRRKRIDVLLEAMAHLTAMGVDAQLSVVGGGNLLEALQLKAERLEIAGHVNFFGAVPAEEMPEIYRDHDVFVMSSAHEGMSNAMLEAMAAGLPLVTTPCEGVQELFDGNGIVVEQSDPVSLAAAIKSMLADGEKYVVMSHASRCQAEKFSWQTTAVQYRQLYNHLLDGRN